MRHVDMSELVVAIELDPPKLTAKERLLRWAELVRNCTVDLALYHEIEYWTRDRLAEPLVHNHVRSAFTVAMADPVFQQQGLSSSASAKDIMDFFSLTQREMHEFSCDCGGYIDNHRQAQRIGNLALRK